VKVTRSLLVLICSVMLVGLVYAEDAPAPDKKEPATKPEKKEKLKPVRLTKPWSLLEDLTQDQKEQINKIHVAALEEKKKIDEKEDADCTAVLTDAQKDELLKAEEKEKKAAVKKKGGSATEAFNLAGEDDEEEVSSGPWLSSEFKSDPARVMRKVLAQRSSSEISWKALAGKLHRLRRLGIFDVPNVKGVDYKAMLQPGRVSVIDLSDTDSPQLNNLVIADILRGLQEAQETNYKVASEKKKPVVPALIIIEEAHEFLSATRLSKLPVLFEQVARIAKRGRKRWLGLVFVTQLPQHLPNEVLGLLNNFIIHKITDSTVVSRMQRTVGSIDEGLWSRVPRLAAGQALVNFASFTRPLMVAVDPAPCKRLLVE